MPYVRCWTLLNCWFSALFWRLHIVTFWIGQSHFISSIKPYFVVYLLLTVCAAFCVCFFFSVLRVRWNNKYTALILPGHPWSIIFMSFESQLICDFLLVINSNLCPISHRLATIHPLRTNRQTDERRHNNPVPKTLYSIVVKRQKLQR